MTLVAKVKEALKKELEKDPDMTDKEYEQLFIKYYQHYVNQGHFLDPPKNRYRKI